MIEISQTPVFGRIAKKLHNNAKADLDAAIKELKKNPLAGEEKAGDLQGVRVYKFNMVGQLTLLAYLFDETVPRLTCLALGSHENFYRDLKRTI